jgi:hypothetical protein
MINCRTSIEHWAMTEPFEIAREVITDLPVLMLGLADEHGHAGRAEAAGVDYDGETPHSMAGQIAGVLDQLHDDMSGADLMRLLPAGGARNALDCALWDLRAKQTGVPAWVTRPPPGASCGLRASTHCSSSRSMRSAMWRSSVWRARNIRRHGSWSTPTRPGRVHCC